MEGERGTEPNISEVFYRIRIYLLESGKKKCFLIGHGKLDMVGAFVFLYLSLVLF